MKKNLITLLICLILTTSLLAQDFSSYEIIVRFSDKPQPKGLTTGVPVFDNQINKYNIKKIVPILEKNNFYIYHITCMKELDFSEFENLSKDNSEIIYTQPNKLNKMLSISPNDPEYGDQWGLEAIKADKAWQTEKGNEQIIIGLIDSGVDYTHSDLSNNIWINPGEIPDNGVDDDGNGLIDDWQGWDFTDTEILEATGDCKDRDNDPIDTKGHGTHCAGIMVAETNNHIGIAGVTWFCKIMSIRAGFSYPGTAGLLEDDDVSSAIIYATDNGAKIINISWGDTDLSPIIRDVCQYAFDAGVVIIAAAGNEYGVGLLYPAALKDVISVAALDEDLSLSTFSSYGEGLDLCAPGADIQSSWLDNSYKAQNGTSMSAPFIAAGSALLLSQNPLLTNYEVYNILKNSCDDLGENGYDNEYGYGIINLEKMFQIASAGDIPISKINFPNYNDGFSQDFQIFGTAYCPQFFRYSLTYTDKIEPQENDWLDVVTHNPEPEYYTETVFYNPDDPISLGSFNVDGLVEDSTYYLRLSVNDINGNSFVDIVKIDVDQTLPEFIENTTGVSTRYDFDKKNYYILSTTNEPVKFKSVCFGSQVDTFHIIENKFYQIISSKLPDYLSDGDISFYLEITNKSGLTNTSEIFENAITVDNSSIPTAGFEKYLEHSRSAYSCPNAYDINNNGKTELVFMELPQEGEGTYGSVRFCEKNGDNLDILYTMQDSLKPWSIGDSNGDGKYEVLGNIRDSVVIYEAPDSNSFPADIVDVIDYADCGAFYDLDNDGKDELIVRSTDILDTLSHYDIYKRQGNDFYYTSRWFYNRTPTGSKNELSPHIQFGYLDDDDYVDVLLSDIDGDIIVYEIISLDSIKLVDSLSIPVQYAYYSGVGNFDEDEQNEFIIGGYRQDIVYPDNQFWYYAVFKSTGDDQYEKVGFTEISGITSKNGICVADLDNDEIDEVIIAATPDIYIYKLQEDEFKPVWVGESYKSSTPAALDIDNDGVQEVCFNQKDELDSLRLVVYHYSDNMPDISTPQDFRAKPINSNTVNLSWRPVQDTDFYNIYRRLSDEAQSRLDSTFSTAYVDTSVFADSFYYYQVSAVKDGDESYRTLERLAVPSEAPVFDSLKLISLNSIQLDFDKPLNQTGMVLTNYMVDSYGYPSSAVFLFSEKSVLLTFEHIFEESESPFLIEIKNIEGYYGTSMQDTTAIFQFQEDLIRPYISGCSLVSNKQVKITFSESIKDSSAENINNYDLLFPDQAGEYEILYLACENDEVMITLSKALVPMGKSYFIKATNIEDLAGNLILPGNNFVKITLPITNLDNVVVCPNPVRPEHNTLTFQNLPTTGKADIFIHNFAGEFVRKIPVPELGQHNNAAEWDLKNASEKDAAAGIYFYLIKYSKKFKKGKIALIR